MSKKLKGVSSGSNPYSAYEDARTKMRHQSLMQDYQELREETDAMKNKLQLMKQKKLTLLAEVRFLRQRYNYLMNNHSPHPPSEPVHKKPQNYPVPKSKGNSKERKTAASNPPEPVNAKTQNLASKNTNSGKGRTKPRVQNPARVFDLNQKAGVYSGKESALRYSAPILDNQKERIYSEKEAAVRTPASVFDLNQISREEEETQVDCLPVRVEDVSKKCLVRGGNEEPNDMKLFLCRNVGDGPNRVGKRKISWQDQVALRV